MLESTVMAFVCVSLWWHRLYCTVDSQTETNHLTIVVSAYLKANFSVALRADLTITKIHC